MTVYEIKIECEENGFHIIIDGDSVDPEYQAGTYSWRIEDPEQLYDRVKAAIGPWLYERDQAFAEFRQAARYGTGPAVAFVCSREDVDESGGYDRADPKHPSYHDRMSEVWDNRAGK